MENQIFNESCLDTMNRMGDCSIDLVVTSPPYDNLRSYGNNVDQTWGESIWKPIISELCRVIKEGGVIVWVVGDATIDGSETGSSFKQALYFKECGLNLTDTMIYQKGSNGAVGNNKIYWQSFEYMFVFSKGYPATINLIKDRKNKEKREMDKGTKRLKDGELIPTTRGSYGEFGRRTNIWSYLTGRGHSTLDVYAFEHPATFPENLAHDHIISWSNEGDLVYDPFLGSGTTAKMAKTNHRKYIGSEINEDYFKIAQKRLSQTQEYLF
tara:strand:+ start:185 stop:988 length:804 start_codon:yes stop_codon:yes gene_type:complete